MRIRSLEISGFKSFPDRVVLTFPPGICAIVGPNGCGKSNIVDAIRWVMGEQSPRQLRGRTMEDLIFTGSESKAPVSMASVTLTLDNSDGTAPPDYRGFNEIQISRRLYRDGEGEYRINKVPCRLRDIVDFFLDTGVGTRGYTIVEQGQISEIVSTRPQDRRFIIEEAAGIGKYRQRRRETERKLESTEQNMVRVTDILGELRRQLGMLERQSGKAQRYRELAARLREVDLSLAADDLGERVAELARARRELEELRGRTGEAEGELADREGRLSGARDRKLELEGEARELGERLYELRSEIQALEGRIQYERREKEELGSLAGRRQEEIRDLQRQADQYAAEETSIRRERSELELRLEHEQGQADRQREELGRLGEGLAELQGRREALARRRLDLSTDVATIESRAEGVAERRRDLERRLRGLEEELEAAAAPLEAGRGEERVLEGQLAKLLDERESLGRQLAASLNQRQEGVSRRGELERELEGVVETRQLAAARLESLEEAEREARRRAAGPLGRMAERDRQRVRSLLSELLEVQEGFERAVEAALESVLQGLVVDTAEDALSLLGHLRTSEAGRATLLSRTPADAEPEAGFVPLGRPLSGFVDVKPPYQALVGRLLRETYLVDDLREVVDRYGLARPPATFVTRDGDLLDRRGALTGGAYGTGGTISRSRAMRDARTQLKEADRRRAEFEASRQSTLEAERGLEDGIENTRSRYHSAELAVLQHEKDLERARERRKNSHDFVEACQTRKSQMLDEIERAEQELGQFRERGESLRRERDEVEREVTTISEVIAERSLEVERVERGLVERQVELASLRERRDQLVATNERIQSGLRETKEWVRRREEEVHEARDRVQSFETGTAEATAQLTRSLESEEGIRARQEEARSSFESVVREVEELEREIRHRAREREGVREQTTAAELRAQELRLVAERTTERVRERYGIDLGTYTVPPEHRSAPREQRADEAEELQRRLDGLGPVHQGAIEEYEEVAERHRYLTEQKADIEASVEQLRNAIARINRTSRTRFRETFDRVNAEFRKIFPRLFRGGRAYLALTEGEDILEAGIEIVAQPPGKKLQNLNLLSGGEKSLTALALLFAVFNVKPSPFFLLDEVDAALDDVNVGRFDELMREVATGSQFLLITHNKATIEVADTLYGVTMEEPGASKVVTVELVS